MIGLPGQSGGTNVSAFVPFFFLVFAANTHRLDTSTRDSIKL